MSYINAQSIPEALNSLKEAGGEARIIAGGTDLYLQPLPPILVDITRIKELGEIRKKGNELEIGAGVTHEEISASCFLQEKAKVLSQACSQVGSPQIRNLGTLGGNVVNAAPAADSAVGLITLEAKAVIKHCKGENREVSLEQLYQDYHRSALEHGQEILTAFRLKYHGVGEGSAFQRFASRKALSLPMVSAGAWVSVEDGHIVGLRLVAAPINPAPTRLRQTEQELLGEPTAAVTFQKAADLAWEEVITRDSPLRGSAEYRRHLATVGIKRALEEAVRNSFLGKPEDKAGDDH